MSDNKHKLELVSLLTSKMKEIDLKPLHPKNKILLYGRYVLPKLSWHLTITQFLKLDLRKPGLYICAIYS